MNQDRRGAMLGERYGPGFQVFQGEWRQVPAGPGLQAFECVEAAAGEGMQNRRKAQSAAPARYRMSAPKLGSISCCHLGIVGRGALRCQTAAYRGLGARATLLIWA